MVTRSGRTYRLPEALPSRSRQDSPLAISRDGRKIAYYSAKEATFQVRDLASGATTTAPMRLPAKRWLYSITRLMVSDDGRYLAFSRVPELKDPALLFDLDGRVVRELPPRWVPIGLSPDGATITLAEYSPNSRLRTISGLWPPTSPGDSTAVVLPQHYAFSPLAPDGRTVAAVEDHSTAAKPCRMGDLVLLDSLTGRKRKTVPSVACRRTGRRLAEPPRQGRASRLQPRSKTAPRKSRSIDPRREVQEMSIRLDNLDSFAELPEDALDDIVGGREMQWEACFWTASAHKGQTVDRRDHIM
ncbi:hypothetical protein [Nonomuraea sp. NPDC050310]|uniref:hypothetical protein n=1 Tax=Nonomuraea sp. NPDC050310 TaxID=3154935 RepID=UPI0033EA9342